MASHIDKKYIYCGLIQLKNDLYKTTATKIHTIIHKISTMETLIFLETTASMT